MTTHVWMESANKKVCKQRTYMAWNTADLSCFWTRTRKHSKNPWSSPWVTWCSFGTWGTWIPGRGLAVLSAGSRGLSQTLQTNDSALPQSFPTKFIRNSSSDVILSYTYNLTLCELSSWYSVTKWLHSRWWFLRLFIRSPSTMELTYIFK